MKDVNTALNYKSNFFYVTEKNIEQYFIMCTF